MDELRIYENEEFTGQLIILDGCHFIKCTFTNCMIRHRGGNSRVEDCIVDPASTLLPSGQLEATLQVLEALGWGLARKSHTAPEHQDAILEDE